MARNTNTMIAAAVATMAAAPLAAQSGWVLPTEVQSTLESTAPAPASTWILPNPLPFATGISGARTTLPVERPEGSLFARGTIIGTEFSGTAQRKPVWRQNQPQPDAADIKYSFIDLNGVSARLIGVDRIGFAMNGSEVARQAYDNLLARDVGQVFGIAIDNAEFRNLYLTATSAYGLNIVGPDADNDTVEERLYTGTSDATWMAGQWGGIQGGGPGSIYKVDGRTGQVSLFANVTYQGQANQGAALGNIAFDALHEQLFVTDRQTGMIHRFDLDGTEVQVFDHGALNNEVYAPQDVTSITDRGFDVEDASTWGIAPDERRVWGIAAHGGRLYYAVADGPAVWSVGINPRTGSLEVDAREEFILPRDHARAEVSDMVFSGDGALILGQRGPTIGAFDYQQLTREGRGAVLRYVRIKDPQTDITRWVEDPQTYPVGFETGGTHATGGVAVGPHYDPLGAWDTQYCGATLWATGERLRYSKSYSQALARGGASVVDGVQAQSIALPLSGNTPPWKSYFIDFDGIYPEDLSGHIGDVEVVGCRGAGGLPQHYGDPIDPDNYVGVDCTATPWLCKPADPPACMTAQAEAVCNKTTGEYELTGLAIDSEGHGLDTLKLSDPAGVLTGFPYETPMPGVLKSSLAGLFAGQTAQVALCGYNNASTMTGAPYPCCNATLEVTVPDAACEKEAN